MSQKEQLNTISLLRTPYYPVLNTLGQHLLAVFDKDLPPNHLELGPANLLALLDKLAITGDQQDIEALFGSLTTQDLDYLVVSLQVRVCVHNLDQFLGRKLYTYLLHNLLLGSIVQESFVQD